MRTTPLLCALMTLSSCAPTTETDTSDRPARPAREVDSDADTDADTDTDADADADSDTDSDTDLESDFRPAEGTWVVEVADMSHDDCGLSNEMDRGEPGATMLLNSLDGSEFQLKFENSDSPVSCNLVDETGFDCEITNEEDTTAQDYGLDALLLVEVFTSGNFGSDTWMDMSSEVQINCTGPDCATVEIFLGTSFPCAMQLDSELGLQD